MNRYALVLYLCLVSISIWSQTVPVQGGTETKITLEGRVYPALITDLDNVSITALRTFANDEEYRKYQRFRNYAAKVYPYAKEAIRIFRELEYASQHMSKREQKKRISELEVELTKEFEEPLKNLTKLQGKIMIKMIEKETGKPIYHLIKDLKGGFTKLYSYDLKEGYNKGQYPILDAVLQDFDVSYRIENETSLKYVKLNRKDDKK